MVVAGAAFVVSIVNAHAAPATFAVAIANRSERDILLPESIAAVDVAGACGAWTIVFGRLTIVIACVAVARLAK